jgi:hypothetical protein
MPERVAIGVVGALVAAGLIVAGRRMERPLDPAGGASGGTAAPPPEP